ncbi:MAG: ATP-binding cassette domain-containing protein [Actinomycetota bacterium]
MNTSNLALNGVSVAAADRQVLDGVDLTIEATGFTVIAGPSGAGKSSLLRLLNRLDVPSSGTVTWRGDDLSTLDVCAHRREVGYVAQHPVLFEGTAADNLAVADPSLSPDGRRALLARVGLGDIADQEARTLSGGEAQRLCLARTLATGPKVILADEPTASLDAEATRLIEQLAVDLARRDAVAWIWVSHDPAQIGRLADTVVVMADGTVEATGTIADLATHTDPTVRQAVGAQ